MSLQFIANASSAANQGQTLPVFDPSTGQAFDTLPRSQSVDIDHAVRAARDALDAVWLRLPIEERGQLLQQWGQLVHAQALPLTLLHSQDTGLPWHQACCEILHLAQVIQQHALHCLAPAVLNLPDSSNIHAYRTWKIPYGVCAQLLAWNDALTMVGRFVIPALAAGNTCVLKPSLDASLCVLRIAELAAQAGLPAGTLNVVTGLGNEAGDALVRHFGVDHISISGSPRVVISVQQAATLRQCPVRAEMGGSNPMLVFADAASQPHTLEAVVQTALRQAGQSTWAGKRLLVESSVYETVMDALADAFEALRVGPAGMDLDLGALTRQHQQQHVWDFLSDAQVDGIALLAQGQIMDDAPESGFYQAPALLRDVPSEHRLARTFLRGPVVCAMPFENASDAISLANVPGHSPQASVWTCDTDRQLWIAERLQCGHTRLNPPSENRVQWPVEAFQWLTVASCNALPSNPEASLQDHSLADSSSNPTSLAVPILPLDDMQSDVLCIQSDQIHYTRTKTACAY